MAKWGELETLLDQKNRDADRLHELFIQVSSDLSYARTFYPNRSVRLYLNNLTQRVFDSMGSVHTGLNLGAILHFFRETLPAEVWRARSAFFISGMIFILSVSIGIVSSAHHQDFARVILGERYIQITDENINRGDPMAIYKDDDKVDMFLGITFNNIKVAFFAFVFGLLGTVGTVFILMFNGIMLGTFQYYFYSKGLFLTSFLTIWIHGTIEIAAIIIAGAAGIVLGSGLLFPGTYERLLALQVAAKRALRIVLGTVPLFFLAGILESFVTRYTGLPTLVKAGIIVLSLVLIFLMWILLPLRIRNRLDPSEEVAGLTPEHFEPLNFRTLQYRTTGEIFIISFAQIRQLMGPYLKKIVVPACMIFAILSWYHLSRQDFDFLDQPYQDISLFSYEYGGMSNFLFFWMILFFLFLFLGRYVHSGASGLDLSFIKQYFLPGALLALMVVVGFYFLPLWLSVLLLLLVSPQFLLVINNLMICDGISSKSLFKQTYQFSILHYLHFIPPIGVTLIFYWVCLTLIHSGLTVMIVDFLSWHELFRNTMLNEIFLTHLLTLAALLLIFPLTYFLMVFTYYSVLCRVEALDLKVKFKSFGQNTSILERL